MRGLLLLLQFLYLLLELLLLLLVFLLGAAVVVDAAFAGDIVFSVEYFGISSGAPSVFPGFGGLGEFLDFALSSYGHGSRACCSLAGIEDRSLLLGRIFRFLIASESCHDNGCARVLVIF